MERKLIIVDLGDVEWPETVEKLDARRVETPAEIEAALELDANTTWVAKDPHPLRDFIQLGHSRRRRDLLLLEPATRLRLDALRQLFDNIVAPETGLELLPTRQIFSVLAEDHPGDYFIGAGYDADDELLLLYRGNMETLSVKRESFEANPVTQPDPEAVAVGEGGQTLNLGDYEVGADSILYQWDAKFRRRKKENRRQLDDTFGGSVRRLRMMRGLNQDEVEGVTERTVRRIEKNEVKPRSSTVDKLADALEVESDEIDTY